MVKRIVSILLILLSLALPVLATDPVAPYVVDNADLLTDGEYDSLLGMLKTLGEELQMDVVVVTVPSLDGKSAMAYADDYYDYNGYRPDGVLLLITMAERRWHISTTGRAIRALTEGELASLEDQILPDLSAGNYAEAFHAFARGVERYAASGSSGGLTFGAVAICIIIGAVAAFIVTGVMKSKMRTVRSRNTAAEYVRQGSMNVTHSRDVFLYRNVTRRAKPKNNGSSTHRSSSGRSHGGRGGRF